MNISTFKASALLFGTAIGAGVLAIPYIVSKSGFLSGLIIILILGLAILFLNLFLGEVILRTKGNHQIPGYAEKYLGKIISCSMLLGIYGAITAYLIGEGQVLSSIFGLTPMKFSIIFFCIIAILVFIGLKAITRSEMIFSSLVISLIVLISIFSFTSDKFNVSNLAEFNLYTILLSYGVVLFAFLGTAALPEMKEVLTKNKKKLKKAIIIGSLIPLLVYILFTLATIGITGLNTTEVATIGLGSLLGKHILIFGSLFAAFAMFTSSLTLSLAMKEIFMYDYKIKPVSSWALTIFIPLAIFISGARSFVNILGITGALIGSIDCILIVLMFWRAKKLGDRTPEYNLGKKQIIGFLLILIFLIGMLSKILELI